jgi:hypothetical protein
MGELGKLVQLHKRLADCHGVLVGQCVQPLGQVPDGMVAGRPPCLELRNQLPQRSNAVCRGGGHGGAGSGGGAQRGEGKYEGGTEPECLQEGG